MSITPSTPAVTELALLREEHAGPVFVPGDEGYEQARMGWNLYADQHPAVIAIAASAADVQAAVSFARRHGLRVAPQGTGHNAGALGGLEGALLLRTTELRGVEIDPGRRVARVEAGAEWQDVTGPAAAHGLAPLAGSSPDVGVVGYTLGGGLSWLGRKHGLAASHLIAADVVLADGSAVRVDADTHPELLWALRGGGGAFAVVTAIEFRLFELATAYAGFMLWPWERSDEILNAWVEWTATAPEEITTAARIIQVPPFEDIPEIVRGKQFVGIDGAHCGDVDDAIAALAPLRALEPAIDTFASVPTPALSHIHMDPESPVPGVSRHAMTRKPTAEVIAEMVRVAGPGSTSPLVVAEFRHAGGALGRHDAETATGSLPTEYVFFAVGIAAGPEATAAAQATLGALDEAISPIDAGRRYSNFEEDRRVGADTMYDAGTFARLRHVKSQYDPTDTILSNHPIPPVA
jgi:hypothetical protein